MIQFTNFSCLNMLTDKLGPAVWLQKEPNSIILDSIKWREIQKHSLKMAQDEKLDFQNFCSENWAKMTFQKKPEESKKVNRNFFTSYFLIYHDWQERRESWIGS